MLKALPALLEPPGSRCRTRLRSISPECKARPSKQDLPAHSTAVPGIRAFVGSLVLVRFIVQAKKTRPCCGVHEPRTTRGDARVGTSVESPWLGSLR